MTTETTSTTKPAAKESTVIDDMASRSIFGTAEAAFAYLARCQTEYADFGNHPHIAVGITQDEEGNSLFDPEVYDDSMDIAVAVLTQRGEEAKARSTVKAIVIYPSPKLDSIIADAGGKDWLEKIIQKEINHVAVRNLRKAANDVELAEALEQMPRTLADYTTSNRESSGGQLEAFEKLWKILKDAMAKKFRAWSLIGLSKKEMRRGMESASYAAANYPQLETRKQGSLFELVCQIGSQLAPKQGLDPAIFHKWLETRVEKVIEIDESDEDNEFDLDAISASISKDAPIADAADEPVCDVTE